MSKKAYDIKWDVDFPEELENLPKEIYIPDGLDDEEEISDYITAQTGFCHKGFQLKDLKKYAVTISLTGMLFIEAASEEEAKDIADHQTTDTVSWSEDWEPTDCFEDDSALGNMYIHEKAFE